MHHTDIDELERSIDIADFYVFRNPNDPSKTILITNVNFETPALAFSEHASYEWKIDVNGDAQEEISFHALFQGEPQTATVFYNNGRSAQKSGGVGEIIIHDAPVSFGSEIHVTTTNDFRFYAGLRGDSFFGDPIGLKDNMQWTGQDFFADKNVFSIVLEVPNSALGPAPQVGVWAQVMAPIHDVFTSVNRMGRPSRLQGLLGAEKFNATHPHQQRSLFLSQLAAKFCEFGYSDDEAIAVAMDWLPDILPYNYASATGYPNGRRLDDDVANYWWSVQTKGRVTSDLLSPHSDYLPDFPFLGQPHDV